MANIFTNLFGKKENRQPLSNTSLLLLITICIFVGMYLLGIIIWGGGFRNPQQFLDLFNNNAYLIVAACGLTIVMITGGIDISVGGSIALITMASVVFMEDHNGGILSSILIALGIGLAMGLVQGYLVSFLKIQPFIVTLAGMFFTRGMTTIVSTAPRTASNELFLDLKDFEIDIPFLGTWARNGNWIPASIEVGVVIALLVVLILWAMLRWTRFGRNLYAVGGNTESALMLGINVRRTQFFAYVLCGVLAGIARDKNAVAVGAEDIQLYCLPCTNGCPGEGKVKVCCLLGMDRYRRRKHHCHEADRQCHCPLYSLLKSLSHRYCPPLARLPPRGRPPLQTQIPARQQLPRKQGPSRRSRPKAPSASWRPIAKQQFFFS